MLSELMKHSVGVVVPKYELAKNDTCAMLIAMVKFIIVQPGMLRSSLNSAYVNRHAIISVVEINVSMNER